MQTKTATQKFPIIAGMQFTYTHGETKCNQLHEVGYYVKQFTFLVYPDGDEQLIGEKEIKRVIYK